MPKRLSYTQRTRRGTYRGNPGRERGPELEGRGAIDPSKPPEHLNDETKMAWAQIAGGAPEGVLTDSDAVALEVAAGLLAKFRNGSASPSETSVLVGLLGRLGGTPADRQRIPRPEPKADEPDPLWAAMGYADGKPPSSKPKIAVVPTDEEQADRRAAAARRLEAERRRLALEAAKKSTN